MTGEAFTGEPETYHPEQLTEYLSDIGTYLGELRYIDRATAYLDDQQASWWHYEPIGQGIVHMEVRLGTTVPFTRYYEVPDFILRRLPWQESKRDEVNDHLTGLAEEADAWAAANLTDLTRRIMPYTHPSPALYEHGVVGPLVRAHELLDDQVTDDFGKLQHSLSDWEGDAAHNFATNFYYPFAHTIETHKRLLASLTAAVVAAKAIAESTQHSLMTVVANVRAHLLDQLKRRATRAAVDEAQETRSMLVLAGGGGSVTAALFGGLWPVAITAVAEAMSAAATHIPDGAAESLPLGGVTGEEILDAFVDAVTDIGRRFYDQQDELEEAVNDALYRIRLLRGGPDGDDGRLIPTRPDIVDGVDAKTFHLP